MFLYSLEHHVYRRAGPPVKKQLFILNMLFFLLLLLGTGSISLPNTQEVVLK